MTTPKPTGRVAGNDLILTRRFRAPIEDVWTSVTVSEHTARWFGPWERKPDSDTAIRIQMAQEQGAPWINGEIVACDPPRRLELLTTGIYSQKRLEITLAQHGDTTEMTFVHHLTDHKMIGEVGPGWEYYLDMLVAAREGGATPTFEQYYPAQKPYYLDSAASSNVPSTS